MNATTTDGGGDYYDRGRHQSQNQRLPASFPAWQASSSGAGGGGGSTSPTYSSPPRRALQPSHSPTRRPPISSSLPQAGGGGGYQGGEAYPSSSRPRTSAPSRHHQQVGIFRLHRSLLSLSSRSACYTTHSSTISIYLSTHLIHIPHQPTLLIRHPI